MSDATLFNLSLLTSDVWAVLAGALLFGQRLHGLYFLAAAVIVAGLFLYNLAPPAPPLTLTAIAAAAPDDRLVQPASEEQDGTTPLASGVDQGAGAGAYSETLVHAEKSSPSQRV